MADFGKLNFAVSFNPQTAFPLDARYYFSTLSAAQAAAATAVEVGSSDGVYFYGENVCVVTDSAADLYIIQPDKTLKAVGTVVLGDDKSIEIVDGKVTLKGFNSATAGQQPRINAAGTALEWYTPDTSTVSGLADTVAGHTQDMDDFYLIHENREYLKYCMEEIRKKCKEYGFVLNEKKTKIAPLRKGVKFLKTKFFLNETGAVIRKMNRKSPVKMRKKLRIFRRWIDEGRFTITDVETAYQSWRGHMIRGNSTLVLRKMDAFYNSLFKNKEDSGHGKVSEERQLARAC